LKEIINKQAAINFDELIEVLRRLRAPDGCPWDREQTSESLVPYLLEETYEIIEAIEGGNAETLKEELGDLTLHILFQAELAREAGQFEIADSIKHISKKLIRRHPHVFDKQNGNQNSDLNMSWEKAKQKEKKRENLLDGVPKKLPALNRARRIQEKAANVGFDWKDIQPVWDKVEEELEELREVVAEKDPERIKDEMGDVFFLTHFPEHTSPFWNMKMEKMEYKAGSMVSTKYQQRVALKCDVIIGGMETIGSAERSSDVQEMKHQFNTISDGNYRELLYGLFSPARVDLEFFEFLTHNFVPRFGGGIGIQRLIRGMKIAKLLTK